MCLMVLIYVCTLCSTAHGVISISGLVSASFGKVQFFNKNYFPSEISNNGVVSRSFLSCADQCLQQQCANMIYDKESRDCFIINGDYLSFPIGTLFEARAPELLRHVEFQQGSWGIGVQSTAPPVVSCSLDAECLSLFSVNSVCTAGSCVCSNCYTYVYPACTTTAARCSEYGKDFTAYPTYVLKNNAAASIKPLSLQQCKESCATTNADTCLSIDYNSKDNTCQLSSDDQCTLPASFVDGYQDWTHYERNCL